MSFDTFKRMAHYFACGAMDRVPNVKEEDDTAAIRKLAAANNILPTVLYGFLKAKKHEPSALKNENSEAIQREIMAYAMKETKRRYEVKNLLAEFEKAGECACVMKGDSLAELYCKNAIRTSGDTDIYAGEKIKESKIDSILQRAGFEVLPRIPENHHVEAIGKYAQMVEVHLTLHDDKFEELWFKNKTKIQNPYIKKTADDGFCFYALEPTDEFVFLVTHFIKHFLIRGAGIKQLADVCLFVYKKAEKIDFDRVYGILKSLKYDKFFDAVLSIGADVFEIDKNELRFIHGYNDDEAVKNEILHDCYTGGVFGFDDAERRMFFDEYTKLRFSADNKGKQYAEYNEKLYRKHLFQWLFVSPATLADMYPYVKKSKLLIPIGHINRAFVVVGRFLTGKRTLNDYKAPRCEAANEAVNKRMELVKKLDMI